jgi:asparagine synthase (glutamine-hydrolysing)
MKTASSIGSVHENIILGTSDFSNSFEEFIHALDVPSIDGLNSYFISKAVAKKVRVALSGLGGDEIFAGYPVFHDVHALGQSNALDRLISILPQKVLNRLGKGYLRYAGKSLFEILMHKRLLESLDGEDLEKLENSFLHDIEQLKSVSLFEMTHYMADTLLRDVDAVCLHNSLECRVPFVDLEVCSYALSIPDELKIRKGINKPLLVDAFSDLLLKEAYSSPKRGFNLPISDWMRWYIKNEVKPDLIQLAQDLELFPDRSPLGKTGTHKNKNAEINYYKWLVLLKWVDRHFCYLKKGSA